MVVFAKDRPARYVLGFFCLLVESGIFDKVKVSFLMVGHTHEDVDQLFSRFSNYLSRHSATTLDKMISAFEQCYTPRPIGIKTDLVLNFSETLDLEQISGHSKPHVFKIIRDAQTGKAKIFWKKWSTDKLWVETEDFLLKSCCLENLKSLPPNYDNIDIDRLSADIKKAKEFFKSDQDKDWWDSFLQELESSEDQTERSFKDIIEDLKQKKQEVIEENVEGDQSSDEECSIGPVTIGKKSNKKCMTQLKVGDMVLTDIKKYAGEWPQMGKIIIMNEDDTVEVHWFKGSKTTAWTPCTKPVKGQKGKTAPWTDVLSEDEIVCGPFTLTKCSKLPKSVKNFVDSY